MATAMDLNDIHKAQLARFAQFFKGKRDKSWADRDAEKNDFVGDRIDPGQVYNSENVQGLLEMYHQTLARGCYEDLEATANLSGVYVSTLLAQVEQMGSYLQVDDISLVEDQTRIGQISALAALQGAPPPVPKPRAALPTIEATGTVDPAVLQEMQDVREELRVSQERNQFMQTELSGLLKERSTMGAEMDKVRGNFNSLLERMHAQGSDVASCGNAAEIDRVLNETKVALDQRNEECEAYRRDMNARLDGSSQFKDLKAIVKKKSDEVKNLKAILAAHGIAAPEVQGGGIELSADSD